MGLYHGAREVEGTSREHPFPSQCGCEFGGMCTFSVFVFVFSRPLCQVTWGSSTVSTRIVLHPEDSHCVFTIIAEDI